MKRTYLVGLAGTWVFLASLGYGCASDEFSGGSGGSKSCSDDDCPGEAGASNGGSAAGEGSGGTSGNGNGGTGEGGSTNGGSGNTSGDGGSSTEGGSSGTANGGSAATGGTSGGTSGMGGTGGVLPVNDYLLGKEGANTAVIQILDSATGDVESTVRIPGPTHGQPMGLAAPRDGTLRLVWDHPTTNVASIMKLDADLNEIGVITVDRPEGGFAMSYGRRADDTGRLLWNIGPGSGSLMTLTSGDRVDTSVPELAVVRGPIGTLEFRPFGYTVLANETARLLWSAPGLAFVRTLTAEDGDSGSPVQADGTDPDSGFDYFPMSYYVGADGLVRISWAPTVRVTPPPRGNEGLVCTYASEGNLGTLPTAQGWEPGTCKRYPREEPQEQLGYATFRP